MGTSMLPALWPGDTLIIHGPIAPPSPGDIVLFTRYGRLFAHRMVRVAGPELITRGDALPERDPPLRACEVLGVVVGISRDGSRPFAVRPPSLSQKIAALAIRRSESVYRMVLRWHNVPARVWSEHDGNLWRDGF